MLFLTAEIYYSQCNIRIYRCHCANECAERGALETLDLARVFSTSGFMFGHHSGLNIVLFYDLFALSFVSLYQKKVEIEECKTLNLHSISF